VEELGAWWETEELATRLARICMAFVQGAANFAGPG